MLLARSTPLCNAACALSQAGVLGSGLLLVSESGDGLFEKLLLLPDNSSLCFEHGSYVQDLTRSRSVQAWRQAISISLQSMGSRLAGGMASGISGQSGTISAKEIRTLRSNLMPHSRHGS